MGIKKLIGISLAFVLLATGCSTKGSETETTTELESVTAADTTENRIELDKNNRIIAWGPYSVGYELFNAQAMLYNTTANWVGVWLPVQFNAFTYTARRPWLWRINSWR